MSEKHSGNRRSSNHEDHGRMRAGAAIAHSAKIGFFAGIIWGLVRWLATGLNFTEVTQAYLLDPFVERKLLGSFWWQFAGWLAFIAMSVVAALVYWLLLSGLKGPWPGLLFGAVWWALFYALAGPLIGAVPPLSAIGWDSIVTDFCLYAVWGLFIGYSIAFELHDEFEREPANASAKNGTQPAS